MSISGHPFSAVGGSPDQVRPHNRKVREVNIRYTSVSGSEPPPPVGWCRGFLEVDRHVFIIESRDSTETQQKLGELLAALIRGLVANGAEVKVPL